MMDAREASPAEFERAEAEITAIFRRDLDGLLRGRSDPRPLTEDDSAIWGFADKAMREYHRQSAMRPDVPQLSPTQLIEIRRRLYVGHTPLGPLGEVLKRKGVEDVHINGTHGGYLECGDHREPLPIRFESEEELVLMVRYYAEQSGKHFDPSNPLVTLIMRDGSRLNAILPPVSLPMVITIRKQQLERFRSLSDLVQQGTIPPAAITLLEAAIQARLNIILMGPTGCGKTTLARLMALLIPAGERVCVLETERELWLHELRPEDFFSLEERDANVEGAGRITLQELFQRGALRQRPARIIAGEVRGSEALDLLHACTSGHDGSLTTLHASSPRLGLNRLSMLAMTARDQLPAAVLNQMVGTGIDMVVQLGTYVHGGRSRRRLTSLCLVDHSLEDPSLAPILQELCRYRAADDTWEWEMDSIRLPPRKIKDKLRLAGLDENQLASRVGAAHAP